VDVNFGCTQCGKCCQKTKIPLTVQETLDWLDAGHQVQLACEASPWPEPAPLEDPKRAHFKRRSFAATSGSMHVRVIAILVAHIPDGCPNLLPDMRCGIYERRPLVCRIYPVEINPFVELKTENKACPPEAWARELPVLQRDGRVVSDVIQQDIRRSRDTDVLDVEAKRRLCAALHVAETAVAREGLLVYSPSMPILRDAILFAIEDAGDAPANTPWRFVSDSVETIGRLADAGAKAVHARDLAAPAPQYLTLGVQR
jgi:Fe-S-cluster containining protein